MKAKLWLKKEVTLLKLVEVDVPEELITKTCKENDMTSETITCHAITVDLIEGEIGQTVADQLEDWEEVPEEPVCVGFVAELVRDNDTTTRFMEEDSPNKSLTDHIKSWF